MTAWSDLSRLVRLLSVVGERRKVDRFSFSGLQGLDVPEEVHLSNPGRLLVRCCRRSVCRVALLSTPSSWAFEGRRGVLQSRKSEYSSTLLNEEYGLSSIGRIASVRVLFLHPSHPMYPPSPGTCGKRGVVTCFRCRVLPQFCVVTFSSLPQR